MMAIGTHALDIGALTPFFWLFEEREKVKLLFACGTVYCFRGTSFTILPESFQPITTG